MNTSDLILEMAKNGVKFNIQYRDGYTSDYDDDGNELETGTLWEGIQIYAEKDGFVCAELIKSDANVSLDIILQCFRIAFKRKGIIV